MMKKLLLILFCLFVTFEVNSKQIHLTCIFNEYFKINDEDNKKESINSIDDEKFFIIDTEVKFFDTPSYLFEWEEEKKNRKDYKFSQNGSVYKTPEDTTKHKLSEALGNNIKLNEYNRTSGKFSQTIRNNKKKTRVVWSGNCSEREIQICENEELFVCSGISNEVDKKIIKIDYPNFNIFDKDGYHKIIFNKKKLEIEEKQKTSVFDDDLYPDRKYTKSNFKGQCEPSKK